MPSLQFTLANFSMSARKAWESARVTHQTKQRKQRGRLRQSPVNRNWLLAYIVNDRMGGERFYGSGRGFYEAGGVRVMYLR